MRKLLRLFAPLPLLLILFAVAPDAHADPVVITGSINSGRPGTFPSGTFTLTGAGFSLGGHVNNNRLVGALAPGTTYHFNGFIDDDLLFVESPFTINGVTYNSFWYTGDQGLFMSTITDVFDLPADPSLTEVSFSRLFTMTGFINPGPREPGQFAGTRTDLAGRGVVTVSFRRDAANSLWWVDNVNYTFAAPDPVPEPSTLLLFGTGAAALGGRLRRRRRGAKGG
jgi:hypothetical protein